jgi:hypothetical protein
LLFAGITCEKKIRGSSRRGGVPNNSSVRRGRTLSWERVGVRRWGEEHGREARERKKERNRP